MEVCSRSLLRQLKTPADLEGLSLGELERLAAEIREYIIESVPRTGGHFGSNLGNVELTVALHHVYRSPHDAVVWDVSHGCYPHKLITGRIDGFSRLKQEGGLSGFLSPSESEHDLATTGHAGTGLSTASGVAWARRALGKSGAVVVVVGDASLPSGLALEALNNLGRLGLDLTIVLNDNGFSIDPTPGMLAKLFRRGPDGGTAAFFESFGLAYHGPIDGHDLGGLIEALRELKTARGPHLLHITTVKGKGHPQAEKDPVAYHSLGASARKPAGPASFSATFGEELVALAARDDRIVAICAGMGAGTGLRGFRDRYPDRYIDVGIAEEHAVTFSAGLALQGLRPVVAIYSTFLQRAYDQIVHDVCLPGLPVVFAIDRAGCVGGDGPTHHGVFDLAYLRHLPHLRILAPSSATELRTHLRAALAHDGPVALRYPRGGAPDEPRLIELASPFGSSRTLRRGTDAAVVAVGSMVPVALEAADLLASRGIELEVVEARSVKPLDEKKLAELSERHDLVVTVEDHVASGGFGSAVAELLGARPDTAVHILGWPDRFIEHGAVEALRRKHGLDAPGVAAAIEKLVHGRSATTPAPPVSLPEVDPETRARLMDEVRAIRLSPDLQSAVEDYRAVGRRSDFLWRWVLQGLEETTLSCIDDELRGHVRDTKALGVMLDVLIDDVADTRAEPAFLEELTSIVRGERSESRPAHPSRRGYLELVRKLWGLIRERVAQYPRQQEFRPILLYDYAQLMNVMQYSALLNRQPLILNMTEHDAYLPHNMHMMISATMDLMASPAFDMRELGRLREVIWHAQQMGRIGNMVTTWEREVAENDFSSGVFAYAVSEGVLTVDDLEDSDRVRIMAKVRSARVEDVLLRRWLVHRDAILDRAERIRSVNIPALVDGLSRLVQLHLSSRGLK